MLKKSLPAVLVVALALGLSACASVAPWQRGVLAQPSMALALHPAQAILKEHIYISREAASGGGEASGGGCGCY